MRNAQTDSREARPLRLHHAQRFPVTNSSQVMLSLEEMPAASSRQDASASLQRDHILALVGELKALWHDAPSDAETASIFRDALEFAGGLPPGVVIPRVWFDECEVVFEWISRERHAIVSCEGHGLVGYGYRVEGSFKPGAVTDAGPHLFPADLTDYLIAG